MATGVVHSTDDKYGSDEKTTNEASGPVNESLNSGDDSEAEKGVPEYGSYGDHVFANERVAEYWRQKYEAAHYEGRHRFDPAFTWTADEEKRLRRKA